MDLFFSIIGLFVNVFLIAQIFILSGENFVILGVFSLLNFVFAFIFQLLGGVLCKKIAPIFVIRLSTMLACALLALIVALQDQLIHYYFILGLLWGSTFGLFMCAYQFLVSKNSEGEDTLSLMSIQLFFFSAVGLIFPVTFGVIINYGNFLIISAVVLAMGIFQMLATLIIKDKPSEGADKKLDIRGYFKAIKKANHLKQGIQLWLIMSLTGFSNTIVVLTTALVVLTFNTHLSLGVLTSAIYVFVMIISPLYKKFTRLRRFFYALAVILPLISVLLLVWSTHMFFVVLFAAAYRSTRSIIFTEEETTRLNAAKYWKGEEFMMESNLFYESALAFGAILSAALVIIVGIFQIQWLVILLLAVTVLAFALHGVSLRLWQRANAY